MNSIYDKQNNRALYQKKGKKYVQVNDVSITDVPESEFVSTKYWCAMCGKWGDHQSPQLHSQNDKLTDCEHR